MIFQFYPTSLLHLLLISILHHFWGPQSLYPRWNLHQCISNTNCFLFIRHKIPIALETNLQNTVSKKARAVYSLGIIVIHHMYLHLCRKRKRPGSNTASKSWNHLWDSANGALRSSWTWSSCCHFREGWARPAPIFGPWAQDWLARDRDGEKAYAKEMF